MSQATNVIADSDGGTFLSNLNAALAALVTGHSGTADPSYKAAGMGWWRTDIPGAGVWTYYFYDGSSKVPLLTFNTSTHAIAIAPTASIQQNYLAGLALSDNGASPNTKIDVASGACADNGNAQMMAFAGGTVDCGTTGANGLDTGSLAASTSYHCFVIGKTDTTTALLVSTSATAPALPSGYTLKRRIGSFRTDGSSHILPFVQNGDWFFINTVSQFGSSSSYSLALATFSVPTGIVVQPFGLAATNLIVDGTINMWLAPAANSALLQKIREDFTTSSAGAKWSGNWVGPPTNTSGQVYLRVDVSGSSTEAWTLLLNGWIDRRGQ